jgi:hypothetical protein
MGNLACRFWERHSGCRSTTPSEPCSGAVAERDPPITPCRELWAIVGRRGGKDRVASAIATHFSLFGNFAPCLRPGERASVLCLACDRQQARIVLNYIKGYFATIPVLAALVERETAEGLELANGVEIIVATNSFRTVRGRSIAWCVFDECTYWRDENSTTPDVETYNAVLPGLTTLSGAMLIGISSPYRKAGLLFDWWRQCYGRDHDDALVVKGLSRTAPSSTARLCPSRVTAARRCVAFVDPSGGSSDEGSRHVRGQKKLAEAGYGGELIVVIAPTELAGIRVLSRVGADQLRRAGLKIDLQEMEFGTVVRRRTSQSPPDKGSWNVFFTLIDRSIPNTHPFGNPACGPTARPLMTAGPTARASRNCAAPGSTPAILPSSVVSPYYKCRYGKTYHSF